MKMKLEVDFDYPLEVLKKVVEIIIEAKEKYDADSIPLSLNGIRNIIAIQLSRFEDVEYSIDGIIGTLEWRRTMIRHHEPLHPQMLFLSITQGHFNELVELKEEIELNLCKYWVEQKWMGEIVLNGKYFLRKPDHGSENDEFICFLLKDQARSLELTKKDFCPKKRYSDIVRDLGFTEELKKIFFPRISAKKIIFRNYLSQEQVRPLINFKKLSAQLKQLQKLDTKMLKNKGKQNFWEK